MDEIIYFSTTKIDYFPHVLLNIEFNAASNALMLWFYGWIFGCQISDCPRETEEMMIRLSYYPKLIAAKS